MKKIICLILVVLMLFTMCACGAKKEEASDKKTFIMGIDIEYPPFSYIDDNGDITGFDVEVCQAVCEKLGWEFKYYSVNWDQKLVQLDSKECDCVWCALTILDSMKEAG
ncbi:MAG: transporter substrate-binding domain-containing protein, partial [Oscillospiraceae bacterium]|nr:transporter substrate-binding domain-containing protein [Oscillospiraceae bacterium]